MKSLCVCGKGELWSPNSHTAMTEAPVRNSMAQDKNVILMFIDTLRIRNLIDSSDKISLRKSLPSALRERMKKLFRDIIRLYIYIYIERRRLYLISFELTFSLQILLPPNFTKGFPIQYSFNNIGKQ